MDSLPSGSALFYSPLFAALSPWLHLLSSCALSVLLTCFLSLSPLSRLPRLSPVLPLAAPPVPPIGCPVYLLPPSSAPFFFFFSLCCLGRAADALSSWWADGDRCTQGRTHKDISGGDVHTHARTHAQTRARTCPHAVRLCGFYQEKCCSGDESLCTLCFPSPPSVVRQQPSEARTMATASAAPAMRSRSHDITPDAVLAGTVFQWSPTDGHSGARGGTVHCPLLL